MKQTWTNIHSWKGCQHRKVDIALRSGNQEDKGVKMEGRGGIKLIIDKGKPKRTDLKYYPNWSWLITPRTKEWEEKALIEKYKKLKLIEDDCIIITPTWQDIKKALIDTIKHESMVDA